MVLTHTTKCAKPSCALCCPLGLATYRMTDQVLQQLLKYVQLSSTSYACPRQETNSSDNPPSMPSACKDCNKGIERGPGALCAIPYNGNCHRPRHVLQGWSKTKTNMADGKAKKCWTDSSTGPHLTGMPFVNALQHYLDEAVIEAVVLKTERLMRACCSQIIRRASQTGTREPEGMLERACPSSSPVVEQSAGLDMSGAAAVCGPGCGSLDSPVSEGSPEPRVLELLRRHADVLTPPLSTKPVCVDSSRLEVQERPVAAKRCRDDGHCAVKDDGGGEDAVSRHLPPRKRLRFTADVEDELVTALIDFKRSGQVQGTPGDVHRGL